jgi:hypothetical protein
VTSPEAAAPEAAETPAAEAAPAAGLIVEDDAAELGPGQARKGDFLAELRTSICATADAVLASVGQSTRGCPYIEYWIGYYSTQSSQYIERAIRKYAPETVGATAARDYIPLISERVRQGVVRWATTGEIAAPEGLPTGVPAEAGAEGVGVSGEATGSVAFKRRNGSPVASDPRTIQAELGGGQPLEGALRQRMELAYGHEFSRVRVHADSTATTLSDRLNARAFTVGEHVAFASGEYRPGTLVGDALIAHELAHVVQQAGAGTSGVSLQAAGADVDSMEEDADSSAVGAVVGLWGRGKLAFANIVQNAIPRLKSGLQLQRCPNHKKAVAACGATFSLANQTASGAKPSVSIQIGPVGGKYILVMRGIAPANYQPKITVHAGSDAKAREFEVGLIQNLLSTKVEYTFTAGGPVRWPLPTPMKDGAPNSSGVHDDVFAENGKGHPGILVGFSADGDAATLKLPDTPGDAGYINLADNPECAGATAAGTMTKAVQNDFFRTWVGVRHKPSGCVTTIHHIDWNIDWSATVNGGASPPTRTVTGDALNVTEPDGNGAPKFLQGSTVPADLTGNRVCGP